MFFFLFLLLLLPLLLRGGTSPAALLCRSGERLRSGDSAATKGLPDNEPVNGELQLKEPQWPCMLGIGLDDIKE